jgi:hypothetical protein
MAAPVAAFASSSLVLNDGQVIKGSEIKRQGDAYLVTMADGNKVAFPVVLVKELRFDDDGLAPAPLPDPVEKAWRDPKDQLKALGPPTQWSPNAVDTTWAPVSGFDVDKDVLAHSRSTWSKSAVDTTWVPKSGFDMSKDVFAGRHSIWSKDAVDTTWKPSDGFGYKPPSFKSIVQRPPEIAAAGPSPWACAESLFAQDAGRPAALEVHPLKTPLYASLGVPLYEAVGKSGTASRKAVFTIADGACRLVGGDADALLGLNLTTEHTIAEDSASINAATTMRGGTRVPPGVNRIDYALAFVTLADPQVSGANAATLKMIAKPDDLRSITAKAPGTCSVTRGRRRKEERTANSSFASPKTVAGRDGDVVSFLTWSSAGGILYRNTVLFARDGVVSAKRDIVASHLGSHQD